MSAILEQALRRRFADLPDDDQSRVIDDDVIAESIRVLDLDLQEAALAAQQLRDPRQEPDAASSPGKPILPRAWSPTKLHRKQLAYWNSKSRFNAVPAGRRGGKTMVAKRRLVKLAIGHTKYDNAWFIAAAPTNSQAKRIYWRDLVALVPKDLLRDEPSVSNMTIPLYNGADIQVMGMDVPERVEGRGPLVHILLDEYGNMKKEAWTAHIRPALTDTQGTADLIGVPEGRNHYYDTAKEALADQSGDWQLHTWTTEEVLPLYLGAEAAAREIAAAKRDMDELTYKQEYLADFVSFSGRAYYTYDAAIHSRFRLPYVKRDDLILCFDFNVSPGVAAIVQEHRINMDGLLDMRALQRTCVIGEVYIPQNSTTPAVCRRILQDWGNHEGEVYVYGDPSGGAGGSAKVEGSDWDLIDKIIGGHFGERYNKRVDDGPPAERARVNAVNSRLKSVDGTVRAFVDPTCIWMAKDLEGVPLLEGGSGEIDKKKDKKLTHITDAWGYYVEKEFPTTEHRTTVEHS